MKRNFAAYFELIAWIASLVMLACMQPATDTHYSLCAFKWLGFSFCPGCGLGHSIAYLFHGEIAASLHAHPLGIFAMLVLLHRIYTLTKRKFLFFTP